MHLRHAQNGAAYSHVYPQRQGPGKVMQANVVRKAITYGGFENTVVWRKMTGQQGKERAVGCVARSGASESTKAASENVCGA